MSVEGLSEQIMVIDDRVTRAPFAAGSEALQKTDMSVVIEHLQAAAEGLAAIREASSSAKYFLARSRDVVHDASTLSAPSIEDTRNPHLLTLGEGLNALDEHSITAMHASAAMFRTAARLGALVDDTLTVAEKTFNHARYTALTAAEVCCESQQGVDEAAAAYLSSIGSEAA